MDKEVGDLQNWTIFMDVICILSLIGNLHRLKRISSNSENKIKVIKRKFRNAD